MGVSRIRTRGAIRAARDVYGSKVSLNYGWAPFLTFEFDSTGNWRAWGYNTGIVATGTWALSLTGIPEYQRLSASAMQQTFNTEFEKLRNLPFKNVQTTYSHITPAISQGTMYDFVVPNYRDAIHNGAIINNPMDRTVVDGSHEEAVGVTGTIPNWGQHYESGVQFRDSTRVPLSTIRAQIIVPLAYTSGELVPIGLTTVAYENLSDLHDLLGLGDMVSNAIADCREDIQSSDVDVLVSLAELPETVDYLVKRARTLSKIVKDFKKGTWRRWAPKAWRRFKSAQRDGNGPAWIAKYLSDAWMEARYAIRPIIYDVENVRKLLTDETEIIPRKTFRGKRTSDEEVPVSLTWVQGAVNYRFEGTRKSETTVRAGILCAGKLQNAFAQNTGLYSVASAGYELITLSFVAGWFLNFTNVLYSLQPNAAYTELTSWAVTTQSSFIDGVITATLSNGTEISIGFSDRKYQQNRLVEPEVNPVTVDVNLDIPKSLDLLAILRGARNNSLGLRL